MDREKVIATTLRPPPKKYGVTHWSSRLLADHLGIGYGTVAALWREYGVRPWRKDTFKFSTDPELAGKVTDIVGLYMNPPENAIVLCIDWASLPLAGAKSQIQALDRTAPTLPMRIGVPEKQTHDYIRHGTTTLFAALEIATGTVAGACKPKHREQEVLSFLTQVGKAYPEQELHLVMDNYATHKTVSVKDWLAENPRIHCHFTRTSVSWMNLAEVWLGIIERQAIHRGTFTSVSDLVKKIRAFINDWTPGRRHSSGRKPQTRSWQQRTVKELKTRRTSFHQRKSAFDVTLSLHAPQSLSQFVSPRRSSPNSLPLRVEFNIKFS